MRALFEKQWGTPPGPIDEDIRRAVALTADPDSDEFHLPALDELRAQAEGLASSEEELLLLGLFGEEAERLLQGDPRPRDAASRSSRRRSSARGRSGSARSCGSSRRRASAR